MSKYRTGNHGFLRRQNLNGIVQYLYENAPISRIELARLTKLNKTTVSSLIEELIKNNFVKEIGIEKSAGAGRSAVLLGINPQYGFIVSVEIGTDYFYTVCADFSAKIVWKHREAFEASDQEKALQQIFSSIKEAVSFAQQQSGLLGIAVCVHGLIDKERGVLLFAPNSGWRDLPLYEMLKKKFQTEILIDNEANFAALGEQFFGAAVGNGNVLYLSISEGLGGGIVLGGKMYGGARGIAGEFGHLTLFPDGFPCRCGNRGCWETEVSISALHRNIKDEIENNPNTKITAKFSKIEKITVKNAVEAAENGSHIALNSLKKIGRNLGIGLASLLNIFNPDLVVLGGKLSQASDFILPEASKELSARTLSWSLENTRLAVAKFGSDAVIMGGIAAVFQEVLSNPDKAKRINPSFP
ncbi:MAG: ROK family transcriptional regulator [Pyrinomonadaceae bacterium]|nr:ROK family transcriptional regulator [Pyrinomonadaceae bacterium]